MVYRLDYRRPPYSTATSQSSLSDRERSSFIDDSSRLSSSCSICQGIPQALSFDKIVSGGTCPPCTLRDFMNYLKYIEYDAENLQFFMWYRSYERRFSELPPSERMLSPEWTLTLAETEALTSTLQSRQMKVSADTAKVIKGTGLATETKIKEPEKRDPFSTPPSRGSETDFYQYESSTNVSAMGMSKLSDVSSNYKKVNEDAYEDAGLKWQPFTIQPYRDEISRVIAIYVAEGSPRQLNLSTKERSAVLHALENTTHPSAFRSMVTNVEFNLRSQSHPSFIRWAICNGNRPRVIFARGLGVFLIFGGIIVGILMALSGVSRAWRVFTLLPLFLGISTLIAAWKGMCVVLHGLHHRHVRPWELFQDDEHEIIAEPKNSNSMDSFASEDSANSFEDEPWVAKYQKRNMVRKVFDRELWVEEPALRQIQDTIFLQAILSALIGAAILTAIFVAVPSGKFY